MATPAKPKSRLGRGLSSLISVSDLPVEREVPVQPAVAHPPASEDAAPPPAAPEEQATTKERIMYLPLEQIRPNPHQPRRTFDQTTLSELAASIKSTGLIQPIVVRQRADGYELIAGERRWRASKIAGLEQIPAIVREIDSLTQAQMALIENIQREDLSPVERGEGYQTIIKELGLTQTELAIRLGEDRSTVANHVRLLELSEPVRQMVRDRRLSLGHAKLLAGVVDLLEQQRLAELVLSQDLTVRNLERLVQGAETAPPKTSRRVPSAHAQEMERSLTSQLGMRVQLRAGRSGKGKLVIHYGSLDQFDALMDRLDVKVDS